MDFLLQFPTTAIFFGFFAFVVFRYWAARGFYRRDINKRAPPQAGGAWPVTGHLHLLGGPKPAHVVLGKMADKYGSIFTINLGVHRALVVNSWEMAKECLTTNDRAFANRPKTLAMEILGYNFSMFGFSSYGPYWRQVRRIATLELLSNHRLVTQKNVRESVVQASIKELYQLWVNKKDTASNKVFVEMKRWFNDVTLNVILSIVVGKRCDKESGTWKEALIRFFELSGLFVVADALPFLRWFDIGGHEKLMKKTAKELDQVTQEWLNEHKRKRVCGEVKKGEEDFMDVMLSILDDTAQDQFPDRDADTVIKATCLSLTLAASDTTMVTLTWALSLLLNNPDALKKAQQELDTHVGREKQLKESDINNLTYLQAIVKETLRLYPAGPLSVPHESMEDCVVANYHVPAGTRLLVNIWKIQRDPRVWTNPNEFQPERFLSNYKNLDLRGQNFEFIPFGSGRRMCPGVSFALQLLPLTLASLLHGFEITTPSNEAVDMSEKVGLTNLKLTPLQVFLTPRLPAHLYV